MTKPGAMTPVVALEATVTGGRTIQAYKRGGDDEARERLIEESIGAVVWLGGVKCVNDYVGDPILKKLFGGSFDVGTDKVLRRPFANFVRKNSQCKFSPKSMAVIKGLKVLASVLIADAFIGLVVPPLNQKLTRKIAHKKVEEYNRTHSKTDSKTKAKEEQLTFKGAGISALNAFTHSIENNNVGKLLSTDAGLISGRMYSARNNEERREIAIRDIASIYFYLWAQNHVGNLLNYAQSGKLTRLNPNSANVFHNELLEIVKNNGKEIDVKEFEKLMLGKNSSEIKLPDNIKFESAELSSLDKFFDKFKKTKSEPLQVAKVSDLEKAVTDSNILARIKEMSKLQPLREGEAVVTKQQIIDAYNIAEINNPKLLDKMFSKFTKGAHKDEFKFVSNKKLYGLKSDMELYVKEICKLAKDGKVNDKVLQAAKNKNLMFNGINFVAGFLFAAAFLSTLIPKFQYWYTRKTTGRDEFPGTYNLEKIA